MRPGLQLLFKPEDAAVLPSEKQENCMAAREACSLSCVKSRTNPKDSDANDKPIFGPRLTEPAVQGFSDLLPDSFAPLLSSSHMEILWNQLTPELVHALSFDASIQLRNGPHTIPLNKSLSRPQLVLGSNKASSRIYLSGKLGSIDLSNEDDFDMMRSPKHRSLTMVKGCSATLDPPLAMLNVASTLVHLPSLFEDHSLPGLRQVRIVYFVLTFICSISSLIERFLWIVERKCQIHLSKITASPIFKGSNDVPQWKLKLSFSGHALIFNMIKVPFHAISLPTFIIPAPHALLRNLISLQPLASARLRRENLSAERMLLAILDSVETWNATVKTVASPPSLSIDVTVPGGMTVAGEALLGRDLSAQTSRVDSEMCSLSEVSLPRNDVNDVHSVTSSNSASGCYSSLGDGRMASTTDIFTNFQDVQEPFDSNSMLPWSAEAKLNGLFAHDRINVNLARIHVSHQSLDGKGQSRKCCHATVSGSVVIWRADPNNLVLDRYESSIKANPQRPSHFSIPSPEVLESGDALPSLYSTLLFPDFVAPKSIRMKQLMQYDYSFDVEEESVIDAISVSVGISHPMLKGSTIVTTILESIYAYGSWTAREGAMLNPFSQTRKRNLLRHLPAIDLTIRVGSIFIPEESLSYHDDGQTKWIPRMQGGRMITRFVGGFSDDFESSVDQEVHSSLTNYLHRATEGIKVIADFDVNFFCLNSESHVHEVCYISEYDRDRYFW